MIVLNVKHTHTRKNVPNKRLSLIDKYTDKNKTCVCVRAWTSGMQHMVRGDYSFRLSK